MKLRVLKVSRHKPAEGDLFVMSPSDRFYLFGRVIVTNANPLGVGSGILIYIYKNRSDTKCNMPELNYSELLVAPMITNRLPWSRGYFEHLERKVLMPEDKLPVHTFVDTRGWLFNEYGERLKEAKGPVGQWGLHSFQTIDDEISNALLIELSAK